MQEQDGKYNSSDWRSDIFWADENFREISVWLKKGRILNIYFPFKSLGKISILSAHLNARLSSFISKRLPRVSPLHQVFIHLSIRQTVPERTREPVAAWRQADDIGAFISIGLKGHRLVAQPPGRGGQAEVEERRHLLSLQFYYCLSEWGRTRRSQKHFYNKKIVCCTLK